MTQPAIDPSTLFAQFAPELYFENPVPITHGHDPDTWYLIAEQIVPTSKIEFWTTIVSTTTIAVMATHNPKRALFTHVL